MDFFIFLDSSGLEMTNGFRPLQLTTFSAMSLKNSQFNISFSRIPLLYISHHAPPASILRNRNSFNVLLSEKVV